MIENIVNLYEGVANKMAFCEEAGKFFDKSPTTIKNHWIAGLKQIPPQYQEAMHNLLINWLTQENARRKALIEANS